MTTKSSIKHITQGKIIGISKDGKTAKIEIPRIVADKSYGKRFRLVTKVFADTASVSGLEIGKQVQILACRKVSKTKSWKVLAEVAK